MNTKSIATIRSKANECLASKIKSQASLYDALPVLIELSEAVKAAKRIYDVSHDVLTELNDACAEYALAHTSVFDEEPKTKANGVTSGDITIDGIVYHLASGYGTPKRIDGDDMSQEFLATLPKDWAKASWKIDTVGINRLGVDEKELESQGLYRPAKNTWTAGEAVV